MHKTVNQAKGLAVGDKVANFVAKDIKGFFYDLYTALEDKPLVLIFVRGQWCPFCNMHLKSIQDNLPKIYEKGVNVVVVSPEKSEYIQRTVEKTGAEFTLLYDEGYKISDAFDVTFRPGGTQRFMYNTVLGANLKESHSDDSERLPIPATFIIDKNGVIVWRHFDPNYIKRAKVKDILANIPNS